MITTRAFAQDFTPIPRSLFDEQCVKLDLDDSERVLAEAAYLEYRDALERLHYDYGLSMAWVSLPAEESYRGPQPQNLDQLDVSDKPLVFLKVDGSRDMRRAAMAIVPQITADYFVQLRTISGADVELIEELQRDWRRAQLLPTMGLSEGGNVDVAPLVRRTLPDRADEPEIAGALRQWAIEVDRFLTAIDEAQNRRRYQFQSVTARAKNGEITFEELARVQLESLLLRNELRELNERTIDRVAGLLSDGDGAALEQAWREAKWHFVWYRGREDRRIARALGRNDLSEDQREALHDLQDEIGLLRERVTRQLDRLKAAESDGKALIAHWAAFWRWSIADERQGPRPERQEDDDLYNAAARFVEEIEALGARIDVILASGEQR